MVNQASNLLESLLTLVDPESHQDLDASSDLIFEPQTSNCSMSLSKDRRTVFYNSWLGECSATLLIHSTQSVPSYQRWMLSLTDAADWMIGLCDKQSAKNPMNGPVYGLSCEDNRLSYVTTKLHGGPDASFNSFAISDSDYTTTGKQLTVCSTLLTSENKNGDEADQRPEMVEVFWNFVASRLSFFSRSGQYQKEEIITIETTVNNWELVPFVRLGKENAQNTSQQQWKCSCRRSSRSYQTNCSRCGKTFSGPFITEVVCELC
ncbi:hypothetical protein GOODEAATRI_030115 [Goodea atripinnis]|uniref:Uncharacterized protein n=1 Tax=Goodea atripinnis TaxID=208336 RepID=A0ABV0N5E3_9TELE